MKKRLLLLCCLLLMLCLLAGCGAKAPTLEGAYAGQISIVDVEYVFDKEGGVLAKLGMGGYPVAEVAGTYAIDKEAATITFTLPEMTETMGRFSFTTPSLSGTFPFVQGEGYILIDGTQYSKVAE